MMQWCKMILLNHWLLFFLSEEKEEAGVLGHRRNSQLQLLLGSWEVYAGKAWSCDMLAEPAWNNFAGLRHNPSWYLLISSDHLVWWSLMSTIHLGVTLRSTFYLCKLHVYTLNLQCPGDIVSNTNMACPKVEGNVPSHAISSFTCRVSKSQMPLMATTVSRLAPEKGFPLKIFRSPKRESGERLK